MPNEGNLIPNDKRTPEERRRNARKAGIASGKARRARKTARECAEIYLSLPVSDKNKWSKLSKDGVEADNIDNMMQMVVAMVKAGQEGNVAAFQAVLKLVGEDKPHEDTMETGVIEIGAVPEEDGQ